MAPALRSPRSIFTIALAALLVAVATTTHSLGLFLPSFNTPHTALEGVPHPKTELPPTPGLTRRLAVVLVDGLDYDGARALPAFAQLRRAGVFRPLRAAFPTYTSPAVVSIVAGLSPRESGIRLNGSLDHGPRGTDRVTTEAGLAGVPVELWSRDWKPFVALLDPPADAVVRAGRVDFLASALAARVPGADRLPPLDGRSPARALTFVYIGEVDEIAHQHGTKSLEYRDAVSLAGALVDRYAATLDFDQDTLIVLSDHGHRAAGGHGGMEPEAQRAFLLARGPLLRQGVEIDERPLRDVASTLSVLAGVPVPTTNLGRPMLDLLALGDHEASLLLAAPFDQTARLLCRLAPATEAERCAALDPLVKRLRQADPTAWPEADALHDALTEARDQAIAAATEADARRRLAVAAIAIAVAAALLFVAARRRTIGAAGLADPRSWALPVLHLGAYTATLAALDYRITFSTMKPAPSFMTEAAGAALVGIVVVAIAARLLRPGPRAPEILLVAATIPMVLLAAFVGWDPTRLPPPTAGILVFELGPAVIGAAVASVVVAALARRPSKAAPEPVPRTG
ncbi:MAG: alkaline phosphatase family protein [Byssovorax sp.]